MRLKCNPGDTQCAQPSTDETLRNLKQDVAQNEPEHTNGYHTP